MKRMHLYWLAILLLGMQKQVVAAKVIELFDTEATKKLLALHMANATVKQVQSLIEKGANVNAKRMSFARTAIHDAALWNRIDILEILLTAGGDVNLEDNSGASPLFYVTSFKLPNVANGSAANIMKYLLQHGAAVHETYKEFTCPTPLHVLFNATWVVARRSSYQQCAALLFLYGMPSKSMRISYKDRYGSDNGRTPHKEALDIGIDLKELHAICRKEKKGFASLLYANLRPVRDNKGQLIGTQKYLPLDIMPLIFSKLKSLKK